MTTGKTIALTRQTFVDKVMCLLLNMLSRLVITLLPRSTHLLISLKSKFTYSVLLDIVVAYVLVLFPFPDYKYPESENFIFY